jgi:hypothetical protein
MTILLSTGSLQVVDVACVIGAYCPFETMRDWIFATSSQAGCALDARLEIDPQPDVTPRN